MHRLDQGTTPSNVLIEACLCQRCGCVWVCVGSCTSLELMQSAQTLQNTSSLSHGRCIPCSGLGQLNDVQGWDPGPFINAQGHGEQLIQLSHRHVTCLEEVAPDKLAAMI